MKRFENSLSLKGLFTADNKKPTLVLFLIPFLLTTFKYYGSKSFFLAEVFPRFPVVENAELGAEYYAFASSFLLLGLVPLIIIKFVFREAFSSYGMAIGDWKFGLKAVAVLAPVMILSTYPSSKMSQFLTEYPLYKGAGENAMTFLSHAGRYLFFYIGWEICFRGFMQFGLREKLGDWNAILVQTMASCLVHIGKPDGEIYMSIIGGIVWGIVAFRAKSILYIILVHWLLGVSLDFFICFT
ncbi:MAG: CPBP family intramembrane metalloprotease [Ignavibacteriales bacterium]|nr:CPBP family intramembrane metalloprotease [Ignavibacteriales bacterium]